LFFIKVHNLGCLLVICGESRNLQMRVGVFTKRQKSHLLFC